MKNLNQLSVNPSSSVLDVTPLAHGKRAVKKFAVWSHNRQRFLDKIFDSKLSAEIEAYQFVDRFVIEFVVPEK